MPSTGGGDRSVRSITCLSRRTDHIEFSVPTIQKGEEDPSAAIVVMDDYRSVGGILAVNPCIDRQRRRRTKINQAGIDIRALAVETEGAIYFAIIKSSTVLERSIMSALNIDRSVIARPPVD